MQYNILPTQETINLTMESLKSKGYIPHFIDNSQAVLEKIKDLIPEGASVMNGSSKTLEQVGFIEYLKSGVHKWDNLHEKVLMEKDPKKQAELRRQSVLSDFYLGSVHALSQNGEILIASNTGSQLPHIVFTSPNLIFVVGAQKIVPSLQEAYIRLNSYVIPLEDERMKKAYNMNTFPSKILVLNREPEFVGRKVHVILVNEILGF